MRMHGREIVGEEPQLKMPKRFLKMQDVIKEIKFSGVRRTYQISPIYNNDIKK